MVIIVSLFHLFTFSPLTAVAQSLSLSHAHGVYDRPFALTVALPEEGGGTIRYTLDGSEPTAASTAYTAPLQVAGTTILRAAAYGEDGKRTTDIVTATYLFLNDVLNQPDEPAGYPTEWGLYTQISGRAKADYGMDAEMTGDSKLRPKILQGLKDLPILSIVTDKDNLFSHENDEDRGGIYIFTGPPVGDDTGHGWTRPASVEIFTPSTSTSTSTSTTSTQQFTSTTNTQHLTPNTLIDLSTTCGLRLHGGHGRLAEKNPKHSFRLVFKEKYGPKTLKYPLFGENEPKKFDQLVLRCHFGNAWQHWSESNRQNAQYTRDVWARRMQRKIGRTSVNARYVNLFLNGMYWGMYNLAERVDDQFGEDHLGGKTEETDVIKIEEDGGNHIEASEGTQDAWDLMVNTARQVDGSANGQAAYELLSDSLLDVDNFIDYMIINQYAGNTDWDHHNWYAIRRHNNDSVSSRGFQFLCWDSEIIFENLYENVLGKNNGSGFPTGIFQNLLRNEQFARRYRKRAKELLSDEGLLGQQSVVEVWDSLYHTIENALYAEAARWGDYRRDVHRWQSKGELYTVDNQFMKERRRLLNDYFPYRTDVVLDYILSYVGIDDFEAPEEWVKLTAQMFHEWNGTGKDAQPLDKQVNVDWNMGKRAGGGTAVAGFTSVSEYQYADLSEYEALVLRGTGSGLRILANRVATNGRPWKQIIVSFDSSDPYWNAEYQAIVLPLADLMNMDDTNGNHRKDNYLHLNALKVDWNSSCQVNAVYLVPAAAMAINQPSADGTPAGNSSLFTLHSSLYNLQGQKVERPVRGGIYIRNGKKIVVR